MKKKKVVNFPDLPVTEENSVTFILDFYEALGWQKDIPIEPTGILINKDQWLEICASFTTVEGANNRYVWMNLGPSASESIPYGKVEILEKAPLHAFGSK